VNIPVPCPWPPSEKREVEMRGWVGGGGLNIVCLCRALEAAWDEGRTVCCRNSCATMDINGRAASISESFFEVCSLKIKNKLCGLSPRANYTDRATASSLVLVSATDPHGRNPVF
jgi:hypothetical protein